MAARTSTGVGMGIAVTLLGVATLALLVTTIVFLSQKNAAQRRLAEEQESTREILRPEERNDPVIAQRLAAAQKERKSLVGHLTATQKALMQRVSGSERETLEDLNRRLGEGNQDKNLLALLTERTSQVESLTEQLAAAEAAREAAYADREAEAARVATIQTAHEEMAQSLRADLDRYKAQVDELREAVNTARAGMDQNVEKTRTDYEARIATLNAEMDRLQRERILHTSQIKELQGQLRGSRPEGVTEYALADANIVGVNPADGSVTLSVGSRDKAKIGMTFEIYADENAIRPSDATGEYPAGKASVEINNVGETTSTALILRQTRGNPIVRGDVAANAIYDPNKTYKFVVYGNFDANRDGLPTAQEREDIRAIIEGWGGRVADEIAGDVDFIVLGQKPVLPPEPAGTAPTVIIEEYLRRRKDADRYDQLFSQAQQMSIPILNENRLYTLIGGRG